MSKRKSEIDEASSPGRSEVNPNSGNLSAKIRRLSGPTRVTPVPNESQKQRRRSIYRSEGTSNVSVSTRKSDSDEDGDEVRSKGRSELNQTSGPASVKNRCLSGATQRHPISNESQKQRRRSIYRSEGTSNVSVSTRKSDSDEDGDEIRSKGRSGLNQTSGPASVRNRCLSGATQRHPISNESQKQRRRSIYRSEGTSNVSVSTRKSDSDEDDDEVRSKRRSELNQTSGPASVKNRCLSGATQRHPISNESQKQRRRSIYRSEGTSNVSVSTRKSDSDEDSDEVRSNGRSELNPTSGRASVKNRCLSGATQRHPIPNESQKQRRRSIYRSEGTSNVSVSTRKSDSDEDGDEVRSKGRSELNQTSGRASVKNRCLSGATQRNPIPIESQEERRQYNYRSEGTSNVSVSKRKSDSDEVYGNRRSELNPTSGRVSFQNRRLSGQTRVTPIPNESQKERRLSIYRGEGTSNVSVSRRKSDSESDSDEVHSKGRSELNPTSSRVKLQGLKKSVKKLENKPLHQWKNGFKTNLSEHNNLEWSKICEHVDKQMTEKETRLIEPPTCRKKMIELTLKQFQWLKRVFLVPATYLPPKRLPGMSVARMMRSKGWILEGDIIGAVEGVEVGDNFHRRAEMSVIGLHKELMRGINVLNRPEGKPIATSIVFNIPTKYTDNELKNRMPFIYSGEGGIPLTNEDQDYKDQKLRGGNLALVTSFRERIPIRVITGDTEVKRKDLKYVYKGLFYIIDYKFERGFHKNMVYKFELREFGK